MEDRVAHILSIQDAASFFIYNLSLLIHDLIIFQQILTDSKVVAFYLLLRLLNSGRQHLMLDLLAFFNTQFRKYVHQPLGAEQAHQIVFQGNIESGFSRISLTSGTSAQLVINTSGLMSLRTDDLKPACCPCLVIQLDIRTTSGHVGGNRDSIMNTCLCNDLCLHLMEFGIQNVMLDSTLFQHAA